jgi:hypothetical protein
VEPQRLQLQLAKQLLVLLALQPGPQLQQTPQQQGLVCLHKLCRYR